MDWLKSGFVGALVALLAGCATVDRLAVWTVGSERAEDIRHEEAVAEDR